MASIWLVLHLMIAGRLHWRPAGAKLAGRNALAAFDFAAGSLVLTEAGSKRRASLHVLAGEEGLRSVDPGGVEVFSTDLDGFRAALTAENRTLKRALTDPRIVSGMGNAYSDEILACGAALADCADTQTETRGMGAAVCGDAVDADIVDGPAAGRGGEGVSGEGDGLSRRRWRCMGDLGSRARDAARRCSGFGMRITRPNYCARCQTGGKVLADRGLSRLLGKDWPRTLEELEALKRR